MISITYRNNEPEFYIVKFKTAPFEGIDDYVCLPYTWLISRRLRDHAIVTYPTDEDPFVTRDRVKRKEKYSSEWKFYGAIIKYESDTHSDAEQWIATRNDCGPLVEKESKTTDTQQKIPLSKKLNWANGKHLSNFIDDSWKILQRASNKRPAPSEPNIKFDRKQLKLDEAAQSSSAVVTDAITESKKEQLIIIQDNQSMGYTQNDEAAAASTDNESTEQRTQARRIEQKKQALTLPTNDVNIPPKVIDRSIDEENHSQDQESQLFSNTTPVSMTAEEPLTSANRTTQPNNQEHILVSRRQLKFESQRKNVRSLASVHNDHKKRVHKVSKKIKSTSREIPSSHELLALLNSKIDEVRSLVSTQKPAEKKTRPMNIKRKLAVAAQNSSNLMDQTASSSACLLEEQFSVVSQNHSQDSLLVRETQTGNSKDQVGPFGNITFEGEVTREINAEPHDVTFIDPRNVFQSASNIATQENSLLRSHQNSYQPTNQNIFEQDLIRESKERNNYDHRPNSRTTSMRIPSTGQSSIKPSNQLHLTSELPQQRQSQPNQQDMQRQLQIPKKVTKNTLPSILTKVPNSQSTTPNKHLLNEQQLQANQNKRALVNENHLNVKDNVRQIDEWMEKETLSVPDYGVNSVSNAVTDLQVISDHKMSTVDAPMETTNNFYCNGITSESKNKTTSRSNSFSDRPIASQNSTFPNNQTHPKVGLEQKVLDIFAALYNQMGSTLSYTCDMYNNLQSSICNTAELYKQLMDAVEEFNTAGNLVSNASHTSKLTP